MTVPFRSRCGRLRQLPLNTVAAALGYQRSAQDNSKWKKPGSVISINGTQFYDHLQQTGGGGAIDLVLHARPGGFACALVFLEQLAEPRHEPRTDAWLTVQRYLCNTRALDPERIERAHRQGIITADAQRNAVFAMRDASGKRTGAELVGTASAFRFRGLAKGSRRNRGGFWITSGQHSPLQCRTVMLVESAIDALSAEALALPCQPQMILSTAGAACALPEWLTGADSLRTVICGYDTDSAGELAAERLATDPRVVRLRPPPSVKDWNDLLRKQDKRNS